MTEPKSIVKISSSTTSTSSPILSYQKPAPPSRLASDSDDALPPPGFNPLAPTASASGLLAPSASERNELIRPRAVSDPDGHLEKLKATLASPPKYQQLGPVSTPPSQTKRRLDDQPPPDPTSEPLHKRQRLITRRRHVLDDFSFTGPSINSFEPPSPLFFSHNRHLRPQLPTRYSSSEAAARMLSKAKTEENHVKTVSLPRGTVFTPSITGALQMRAGSDRSSVARSSSPESSHRSDTSVGLISSIGVIELLEQDERPTMIVDLGDSSNYGIGPLRAIYANASIRSHAGLLELATGNSEDTQEGSALSHSFAQFKTWLLSAVVNGESLNVCLPPFKFAGILWSCSTLRKRLRLVNGQDLDNTESRDLRGTGYGQTRTPSSPKLAPPVEEPADYFAVSRLPRPDVSSRAFSGDTIPASGSPQQAAPPLAHTPDSVGIERYIPRDSELGLFDEPSASFDWTRLPVTESMPQHIKFARSIDWAATSLGPIEHWTSDLRQMCNLIMGSPHPAAMYWGPEHVAIYNEAYIPLAGQKHPQLMGMSYKVAWKEIWSEVEAVFDSARTTGEATMKDDDCLFMLRSDYLEETYFSWSIIPIVGRDGLVKGLYNPAFEKTRRKIAERRMLTLREVGERTAAARDVRGFWQQALDALELNEYDTPFALLYSVTDDIDSESSSVHSASITGVVNCHLEGSLGVPIGHPAAQETIDLKSGTEGFAQVFREMVKTDRPVLLHAGSKELPVKLVEGMEKRGFGDPCRSVVICPIHPTTGETILGFLVLGVNPRRPYDDDYSLFLQLLSRQLATSLASVVLFEEEIRRGQRAAKLAALDRMELSEQLAARTQEAIDSETKFTRMAEFAPVGIIIANSEGSITFCNETWYMVSGVSRDAPIDRWTDAILDEDRPTFMDSWRELTIGKQSITSTFRFKTPWKTSDGNAGERWALFSAYPERYANGNLKSIFGSITDISKQKWAEGFQKRKMEEAIELKRQQENFIDMTSHEMRNPLSAILQCADEISTTMAAIRRDRDTQSLGEPSSIEEKVSSTLEASQTIALCAQHQKRIVDDILTLSKLDSELLLVTPVDAQPLTVVQRALKMHEGEMSSNDIRLKFNVDKSYHDLGVDWVRFDPSRVLQVLINLTTNAIKFTTTESKRTITVSIAASKIKPSESPTRSVEFFPSRRLEKDLPVGDWGNGESIYIQFDVQDTGRGLTPEEKKMLFMRFSQASPRTHVQYGGSGLGLFISRQLTELQGGEIGVASEAGKGSTFAFYVQARKSRGPTNATAAKKHVEAVTQVTSTLPGSTSPADGKKPSAATPKALGTKHILLVEDNLVNQKVLQKQLKNLGCVVQVANHGAEALEKLRQSTWWNQQSDGIEARNLSVVLMDQEMPVMDGLTATRKIREMEGAKQLKGHIPIIAVTANARSEQIQTALNTGMDDVVSKPFRIPDLIPKIEELMGKYPEPK